VIHDGRRGREMRFVPGIAYAGERDTTVTAVGQAVDAVCQNAVQLAEVIQHIAWLMF
jgi:hypothetical protein